MSKLRKSANGQSCIRCNRNDGTIVLCHYSGPYQHRFGKGRGIKGNDLAAAELCAECHHWFDEYKGITFKTDNGILYELQKSQRSEEFLALCLLTIIRRGED